MIYYPVMGALFVILIALIIIIAGISEFFLRFALSTSFDNTKKLDENTGYEISDEQRKEEEESRKFLSLCSDVYIKSKDGLKLHAYLARTDSHKYLITVHGYKGGATNNGTLYRYMAKEGYNILVLDVRGHGKSEGRWLSMGLWESDDLMRWIEYINALDKDAEIALHGVSMGAATVMMASGRNPENVKAIIEDCGYSGTYEEFACQLKAMFHLPSHPWGSSSLPSVQAKKLERQTFRCSSYMEIKMHSYLSGCLMHALSVIMGKRRNGSQKA